MTDDALELLRELVAEVRLLRRDVAVSRRATELAQADVDDLARLLPAIAGAIGDEPVMAAQLDELPGPLAVLNGRSARSLGKLFSRAQGVAIAGYSVRRVPGRPVRWSVQFQTAGNI